MEGKSLLFSVIDEALNLDSFGDNKMAYSKYLDGIRILCMYLIEQEKIASGIPSDVESKKKAKQIFSVLKRCVERLDALVDTNDNGHQMKVMKVENINKKHVQHLPPPRPEGTYLPPEAPKPHGTMEIPSGHRPLIFVPAVKSRHHMSAMEQAQKENALLYYAYEKRIAQPTDRSNRISLQLELQRRMAENLALAKAKDAAYRQQKMKKEKKALEMAARKLFRKDKNLPSKSEKNDNQKDWQKQWLYAQMLQFEDQEPWPSNLRKRLKDNPEKTLELVPSILSTPDYPLVEWMLHAISNIQHKIQTVLDKHSHCMLLLAPNPTSQIQSVPSKQETSGTVSTSRAMDGNILSLFDPLLPAVEETPCRKLSNVEILHHELLETSLRSQLGNIIIDITNLTDTVAQLISLNYEISGDFHDLCYQLVEEHVYNFLWWKLQVIFRMCNEETERRINQSIKNLHNLQPEEMDVPSYFIQLADSCQELIAHLQTITRLYTPISKLKTLVQVVEKVNDYSESEAHLNADDLISIIIYLIVQAELPQLVSECDALDCLVPQAFLMGEEGFVLTTFQTALKYLETQMDTVYPDNIQQC